MPGASYDKGAHFYTILTSTIKTEFGGFPDIKGIKVKHDTFYKKNNEIISVELNDHQIDNVNYDDPHHTFTFSSTYYDMDNHTLVFVIIIIIFFFCCCCCLY